MKSVFLIFAFLSVIPSGFRSWLGDPPTPSGNGPRFTSDNRLLWPEGYRQWVWLSSGLGMTYSEKPGNQPPEFDNVFADPASYQAFVRTGHWPANAMLALESREAESHGSINKAGHFQGAFRGVVVEVRDQYRFSGKWTFFDFGLSTKPVSAIPSGAACYSCHDQNGAVDHTFVQFYPTLLDIAQQKGTAHKQ